MSGKAMQDAVPTARTAWEVTRSIESEGHVECAASFWFLTGALAAPNCGKTVTEITASRKSLLSNNLRRSRTVGIRFRRPVPEILRVQKNAYSMHPDAETGRKKPMALCHGLVRNPKGLAIAGNCSQLAGQEVIRRPRTANGHFAVLQLLGCRGVAILVLLHALGVDQMGDVDQHPFWCDLLAADFFLQRIEKLMHLDRQSAGLGLALTLAGRFHPELRQIVAPDRVRQFHVDHGFPQGAVANDQLDVHFGFAAKLGHALPERPPVDPDGLAKSVIAVKDSPEFEWKNGGVTEAIAHHSSMLNGGFMVELTGCVIVFADDNGEFATGIAKNRCAVNSLNALEKERAASAGSIWEGLVLGKTVRVPRHVELSEPGSRRTKPPRQSSFFAKA